MNYGELKTHIAQWYHRTDLSGQMDTFSSNITQNLNKRFGLGLQVLVADTDTNIILDKNSAIYLKGCLAEAAEYTHDREGELGYRQEYERLISDLDINYRGSEWDTTPPQMTPYEPEAA